MLKEMDVLVMFDAFQSGKEGYIINVLNVEDLDCGKNFTFVFKPLHFWSSLPTEVRLTNLSSKVTRKYSFKLP